MASPERVVTRFHDYRACAPGLFQDHVHFVFGNYVMAEGELGGARPGNWQPAISGEAPSRIERKLQGRLEFDEHDCSRAVGDEMNSPRSAEFLVRVNGSSRDLHPILRHEVYAITREAIRNAVHHADAKAIEVDSSV